MATNPVPHHIQFQHAAKLVERPVTQVQLEAARGPMGGKKLPLALELWNKIKAVALPFELEEQPLQTVLVVDHAARFVMALRSNEAKTAKWPEKDRAAFCAVLALLYQHNGLVISRM